MNKGPYFGNNAPAQPAAEPLLDHKETAVLRQLVRSMNAKIQSMEKELTKANRKLSKLESDLENVKTRIKNGQ